MAENPANSQAGMPEGLKALMSRAHAGDRSPPPVDKWNPPFCGDLDIRIARDGTWFYLGTPIGRPALVRLFASVLRKDADGRHYLVTPVEKIGITVDDAPLLAVEMAVETAGEGRPETRLLTVRTNLGDLVKIGPEHPLRFEKEPDSGGLKPYVLVRGRLEALFTRALMYQLADLMEVRGSDDDMETGVWSGGRFFAVSPELMDGAV
ncbi:MULTISPECIES: DUF1285 domain-containing protein [unclassified Roseibium]|uniref:DUF1285 domain-containing protein n=1 Tax=unclassified Roseibium TaxID=2629323 RepID=UPI0031792E01